MDDSSTDDEAVVEKTTKQRKLKRKTPAVQKDSGDEASGSSEAELHDSDINSPDFATAEDSVENPRDAEDSEA